MSMTFEVAGLEEFAKDIEKVIKKYPGRTEDMLVQEGNKFRKNLKAAANDSGKRNKRKLNKSFKQKISGYGANMSLDIYSAAPHYHLVERGHLAIAGDQNKGFVPGFHFFVAELRPFEREFEADAAEFIGKLLEEAK